MQMPELPEVETTLRGIQPHIVGKKVSKVIIRNPKLRWPIPVDLADLIEGKKLLEIKRRAKYLLLKFSNGAVLWHLGMSGNLRIVDSKAEIKKHDHVDVVFSQACILRFNDPRRFGCVLWEDGPVEENLLLAHLGPEPLDDVFDGTYLFARSRKSKKPVKTWIMDGKVVVGVGNIYANEALFAARIHPLRKANKLSQKQCDYLVAEIKRILRYAIQRGGTTLKDFVGGDGKPGYFAQELKVYGRGSEPCSICGKVLTEKNIGQRTTVYCTACQN